MQRTFSTFAGGWPGAGLLLLRATVGVTTLIQGAAKLMAPDQPAVGVKLIGLLAIVSGIALLIGFLTPIASALAGLGHAIIPLFWALSWFSTATSPLLGSWLATLFVVIMAVVLVFLGPGAFSLDARLFGRREIVIPSARSSLKS